MKITIPEGVSFDDWIRGLLQMWFPERDEDFINGTITSFYDWHQEWPDKYGNMLPYQMAKITNMAIMYRTAS